jgi:hypothetical protein
MSEPNDIYQIRMLYNDLNDEAMVWRQYYQITSGTSCTAADLVGEWLADVRGSIRALWPTTTFSTQVQVVNGMDNGDNYEAAELVAGTGTSSTAMPPVMSLGLRCPRTTPGTRHAYHHLGGLTLQLQTTTGKFDSTYAAIVATLKAALDNTLTGEGWIAKPVQLTGGFKLGTPPTKSRDLTSLWQHCAFPIPIERRIQYLWL